MLSFPEQALGVPVGFYAISFIKEHKFLASLVNIFMVFQEEEQQEPVATSPEAGQTTKDETKVEASDTDDLAKEENVDQSTSAVEESSEAPEPEEPADQESSAEQVETEEQETTDDTPAIKVSSLK